MWGRLTALILLSCNHNGVEVLECLYGDNISWIQHCPPKSNNHCSTLQKDIKHYYKCIIISKQIDRGIPALCYVGYWYTTKRVSIELHKFWFCHDDLMRCVGGTNMKWTFDRLALPSLWHVQLGINLTQIEVVALEEFGFLLSKKPRSPLVNQVRVNIYALVNHHFACAPWNLFGNGASTHVYKPLDPYVGPNQGMGRRFVVLTRLNYPLCQKTSGRWDKLPQTFLF